MSIQLEKIESEWWSHQTTVTEDGIIAKIDRRIEKPPSFTFQHLSVEDHEQINTYEALGFFIPRTYQKIMIAIPLERKPGEPLGRVVPTKHPAMDIVYHKVGQAQLWYSTTTQKCVLWECLVWKPIKDRTKEIWEWLIKYIEYLEMKEIYTHSTDRAYDDTEYCALLSSLGFKPNEKKGIMKR